MGKVGKKKKKKGVEKQLRRPYADGGDELPSSAYDLPRYQEECSEEAPEEDEAEYSSGGGYTDAAQKETPGLSSLCFDFTSMILLFTFLWYLEQSPKGDITYLQKFFLMYVGGRRPLHLQEDFCGTALLSREEELCAVGALCSPRSSVQRLSTSLDPSYSRFPAAPTEDWLRNDVRVQTLWLKIDIYSICWLLQRNKPCLLADLGFLSKLLLACGAVCSQLGLKLRVYTLHSSEWLRTDPRRTAVGLDLDLESLNWCLEKNIMFTVQACSTMEEAPLPPRDIICAFNYSCCCLQRRADLVRYFKHTLSALSNKGGIFVMDVYGGTSSERKLRLQRKFTNFTYIWEQGEFDIISRRTRISLHFQLGKMGMLRHAFSYAWRLWSLPEIRDCMEEAGFQSIHFWIREMPNTEENEHCEEYNADRDVKYEDSSTFRQQDSWNAYVVGTTNL
ncbi:hypothetical protein KSP40_PGU021550 [Platanthera guangdongensis]|uniref:Uncharacterized protein n=1 Tax=Platanthera guangdongensis TaxID=2320717 RepID=A0ABR2N4N6_9ASPA